MHKQAVIVIVVVVVVVLIIILTSRKKKANGNPSQASEEYARLVGTAAAAGSKLRNDVATHEGFGPSQEELDNAQSYDDNYDFVGAVGDNSNVPSALQGLSDEEIQSRIQQMNNNRQYEDPRGQMPDLPLASNPFGYDIASPNNYKPINTFGANYRLKGRNFEINLRGSIAPGEVWTGMFKPRGANRTLMGGGLLESETNRRRRIEFDRARNREVVRNEDGSAEVIY